MRKIDINVDVSSEMSKNANITQKDTKYETSGKISSIGLSLGTCEKDTTCLINKTNMIEVNRKDNYGNPIIKGKKSHKIIFIDHVPNSENSYYQLINVVEVESFKNFNRLLFKFNNIDTCNSCSACLVF